MIAGAVDLIRRKGLNATTMRHVVKHTSTPRGSLGFHFPRGKPELIEEVLSYADHEVVDALTRYLNEKGTVAGLRRFIAGWKSLLESSNFEAGCPVLAIAIEPHTVEDSDGSIDPEALAAANNILERTAKVFEGWQTILATSLRKDGVSPARARRLATMAVASIEGTVAMCRAAKSAQALDAVKAELEQLFEAAIEQSMQP